VRAPWVWSVASERKRWRACSSVGADTRVRSRARGSGHVHVDARSRWSTTFASHDARIPHRPTAGQQGPSLPADPPKVEEIIAVMRAAGDGRHGRRLRALIVILWRAGLRIQEALALTEGDLDQGRGALLVRRGKGGRRREVGNGRVGLGAAPALARGATPDARGSAVMRHHRRHARSLGDSCEQRPAPLVAQSDSPTARL
jgi:site-specific recombinase XerC